MFTLWALGDAPTLYNIRNALAYQLGIGQSDTALFVSGCLISILFFCITALPVIFISRNHLLSVVAILGSLTAFTWFGWLNVGLYVMILLITILYAGKIFRR